MSSGLDLFMRGVMNSPVMGGGGGLFSLNNTNGILPDTQGIFGKQFSIFGSLPTGAFAKTSVASDFKRCFVSFDQMQQNYGIPGLVQEAPIQAADVGVSSIGGFSAPQFNSSSGGSGIEIT